MTIPARARHFAMVAAVVVLAGCASPDQPDNPTSPSPDATRSLSESSATVVFPSPQPPSRTSPRSATGHARPAGGLAGEFAAWSRTQPGTVAVTVAAVGGSTAVTLSPQRGDEVAWSTIKVPVALAAIRAHGGPDANVTAALTESDNAAAEAVWASLGPATTAAQAVQQVLADGTDTATIVQDHRVRPGFTAFGQTIWSVDDQAQWAAHLPCLSGADNVLALMGKVVAGQRWGVGQLPGATIKGGWGPDTSGAYLVRQLAIVPHRGGQTSIAISVHPNTGTFDAGVELISAVGQWLRTHLNQLPAGTCR